MPPREFFGRHPRLVLSRKASAEKQKTLKEMLEGLLPAMGAEDVRDREDAQQQWQKLCLNLAASGRQAARAWWTSS